MIFYKTQSDYDSDRPHTIYIITPRRNKKEAIDKARILERRYPNAKITILYEGKHKEEIEKVLDLCLQASKILSPSVW
jgi:predicted transcriptional regulator of viral defense system